MRNYNGFFKIDRKLFSPEWLVLMRPTTRHIFITLLAWANWSEQRIVRGGKLGSLKRGQLVTSDEELSLACEYSRNTIRKHLELLKTLGSVDIKRDNQGTVITICKYSEYQDVKNKESTAEGTTTCTTDWTTTWTTDCTTDWTRNKKIKNLKKNKEGKEAPASTDPGTDGLVNAWNENCGNLPKVIKLGSSRTTHAKARLKENPSLDYWVEIIKRVAASDFCNGQNSRQWVANIDFLLRPDTQFKALEGSYDNKQTKTNAPRKILDGDNIV